MPHTNAEKPSEKRWLKVALLHVVCWLLFLLSPGMFNPRRPGPGLPGFFMDLLLPARIAHAGLLVAIFYCNYFIVVPRLYLRRRYGWLLLSMAVGFAAFFLLNYVMMPPEFRHRETYPAFGNSGILPSYSFNMFGTSFNFFMFIIVYVASCFLRLYEQWQIVRSAHLDAELALLKSQINPHFLFNTLNNIYSLALIKSDDAPDAIIKLSGMMRYATSEAAEQRVPVEREINYITEYIALQRLRLPANAHISFHIQGDANGLQIAPFLFFPFIENAFIHGVNPDAESNLEIVIIIDGSAVHLRARNRKVFIRADKKHGRGQGIASTRSRLELIYPMRHHLCIEDGAKEYTVNLKITLL